MASNDKDLLITIDRNTRITKNIAIVFLVFLIIVVVFSIIAGILMLIYLPSYARNNNLIQTNNNHPSLANLPIQFSRPNEIKSISPTYRNENFMNHNGQSQISFLQRRANDEKNSVLSIRQNSHKNSRNNKLNNESKDKELKDEIQKESKENKKDIPHKKLNDDQKNKNNQVFQYKPLLFS